MREEIATDEKSADERTAAGAQPAYDGPERRVHKIFKTQNREYHIIGDICVAVRDVNTQIWISNHEAIGTKMDMQLSGEFFIGRSLFLSSPHYRVRTSTVLEFERPEQQTVDAYNLVWAVAPG
jgi:hypothetical protein